MKAMLLNFLFSGWGTTAILAILGLFFGKSYAAIKNLLKELADTSNAYIKATSEKSNGGKKITDTEKDAILKEFIEAVEAAKNVNWTIFFAGFKKKK